MAASARAEPLRVAVLPLEALGDASEKQAQWIEEKLHRELKRSGVAVTVLPAGAPERASTCDTRCLLALGKKLGVDRVVAPTLALTRKFTKDGTAWTWTMRQVNVSAGRDWGTFQKLCLCPDRFWDDIARTQVRAMVSFDPAREVALPPTAPKAAPSKAPRELPGMVYVPAGPFIMGTERGEWDDEAPRHLVELPAFYLDETEVTNAAYGQCVAAHRCSPGPWSRDPVLGQADHPVAGPNWHDAVAFCRFAGKRLPTEAEWEKAARGTDEREFPWGNDWHPTWLNLKGDEDGAPQSSAVRRYPQNKSPYGAYDMAGNVWEWTADVYASTTYRKSPTRAPTGPAAGPLRAMRGGSWMYALPFFHTTHNRSPGRPDVHKKYVGFRCARDGDENR